MNKQEYQEKSRKLRLPQRCPLVGYCQRWMWTVYLYSYQDVPCPTGDIQDVLSEAGDLPDDFEEKKVLLAEDELCECSRGKDYYWVRNFCPEVPLFDRYHTPAIVPVEAISCFSWDKDVGVEYTETKHFSECLEFIRRESNHSDRSRKPAKPRPQVPLKLRFEVLKRDNYTCVYCRRSKQQDAVRLEVDHRISVKDGGKSDLENLVTACFDCNRGKSAFSAE